MSKLYEISDKYTQALDDLMAKGFDSETIEDTLSSQVDDFKVKCESTAAWALNQLAIAKAKHEAAKKLIDQTKSIENSAQKCLDYLERQMRKMKVSKVDGEYFAVGFKKLPDIIEVIDSESIPSKWKKEKTTTSIDKAGAKKALQNGESIDGFKLVKDRTKLVIK